MRTARSSSRRGGGVYLSASWETPPDVALETPPGVGGPGDPPRRDPSIPPLGVGWRPARHAGIPPPPVNRITDTCKNITLPQLRCSSKN